MTAVTGAANRSEEHTSELQSHSEISYAVFCLKKKNRQVWREPQRRSRRSSWNFRRSTALDVECILRLRYLVPQSAETPRFFFFNDTATTEIYTNLNTLSLHDALPI